MMITPFSVKLVTITVLLYNADFMFHCPFLSLYTPRTYFKLKTFNQLNKCLQVIKKKLKLSHLT